MEVGRSGGIRPASCVLRFGLHLLVLGPVRPVSLAVASHHRLRLSHRSHCGTVGFVRQL